MLALMQPVPTTMRAAVFYRRGELRVEERPVPPLGPDDVLLRISHCGVCGTDLHTINDGWGRPGSIGGHEYAGTIAAVGEAVNDWRSGEAVIGGPEPGCGDCDYCRAGRGMLCSARGTPGVSEFQGAFAEYMRVHRAQLLRIPEGLSPRSAALAEPLAVALHGITLSGIAPGQSALVTGAGPIGALTLAALVARGVEEVSVSEPSAARRRLAEKLGAVRVVEPAALEMPALPFTIAEDAVHAAFECSGRASAAEAALARLRKAGTLVLSGTGAERPSLDVHRVLLNELVVTGAYCYDERGMEDALALLASGALPTDLLIHPQDVPLDGLLEAMQQLTQGRIGGKLLVAPHPDPATAR
jgi:(R,R)-butanediol dehydrogenase/meso-butanediol dehydrogenase/diacetyl reductase